MKVKKFELILYKSTTGKEPFYNWLKDLSPDAQMKVRTRLDRIMVGNLGDFKNLKEGCYELRIRAFGGLRIYFAFDEVDTLLLLYGGTKNSQKQDIKKAKDFWNDYLKRKLKNVH